MDKRKLQQSRQKLEAAIIKRITTTMIGAISDIEKLNLDRDTFEQLRSSILDRGNGQIRNLRLELNDYEVSYEKRLLDTNIFFVLRDKKDGNA